MPFIALLRTGVGILTANTELCLPYKLSHKLDKNVPGSIFHSLSTSRS